MADTGFILGVSSSVIMWITVVIMIIGIVLVWRYINNVNYFWSKWEGLIVICAGLGLSILSGTLQTAAVATE